MNDFSIFFLYSRLAKNVDIVSVKKKKKNKKPKKQPSF